MKRVLRVLLIVLLLMSNSMTVFAGSGGSGTGGSGGGTGSGTVINPPSRFKTGYVYYIVDGSGNIVAEPEARVSGSERPDSGHIMGLETRFGSRIVPSIEGSMTTCSTWWNCQPFGANGQGYGGVIKQWLISPTSEGGYNCIDFITSRWGQAMADTFMERDDLILCVEPFMFSSLYNGSDYVADLCATSIGWVKARQAIGAPLWSSNSTYPVGNLPNSMAFDIPVLGVPAPTNLVGTHPYELILAEGYGIVSCWSSEVGKKPEEPSPHSTSNADSIKSNELNFIYADFGGKRSGATIDVPMIDMNDFREHVGEPEDRIDDYEVIESKSGDLWNFRGNSVLYYRPASGLWKYSPEAKLFGKDEQTYPQYAYNISRMLWNDDLKICNYKSSVAGSRTEPKVIDGGTNELISYADSILGIKSADKGIQTSVSAGVDIDATYGVSKADSYSFYGTTTEYWQEEVEIESDDDDSTEVTEGIVETPETEWVEREATINSDTYSYSVTHYVDKYKAPARDDVVADTTNIGRHIQEAVGSSYPRVGFTGVGASILKVNPEVEMVMYVHESEYTSFSSTPSPTRIVMMGEYLRKCRPPVIMYYQTTIPSGNMQGKSYVDTALDGTKAFEWSERWGRNTDGTTYQVAAQGSGFSSYTTNHPVINCVTIGLDVQESVGGQNVKQDWSNNYSPLGIHNSFVSNLNANLDVEVILSRFNERGHKFGEDFYMSFDEEESSVVPLDGASFDIIVANGAIVNEEECIAFVKQCCSGITEADARTLWEQSGIASNVEEMFLSNSEANSSGNWYQEDSMCLRLACYKSAIHRGELIFSDKNDYGSSTKQSELTSAINDTAGVQVRFFYNLMHDEETINIEGFDYNVGDVKYLIKDTEILGARYLISNATTADWRR